MNNAIEAFWEGLGTLMIYGLIGLLALGWLGNLWKIFSTSGEPLTGFWFIRIMGFFAPPLGGVVGWM